MKTSIAAAWSPVRERLGLATLRREAQSVVRAALAASALFCALLIAGPALAANYPLELVSPRAVGTAPASGNAAITAGNRIFKAYPGIEYNIRAVVVGGEYPYTFSLSNAPSGMTIDSRTGEITWPNPTGSSVTPTITVRDAEGTVRSSPWTITVTTEGFWFVDAVNGSPSGNGTINSPWRTISNMANASGPRAGDIVYFRNGTYNVLDMPRTSVGSPWERVEFPESKPNIWIAYPNERPVIDFGFNQSSGQPGALIRLDGNNLYVDGFETRNTRVIGFQTHAGRYAVFRRLRMHDLNLIRANLDGTNSSFIMTMSAYSDSTAGGNASSWGQYLAIQDNEFYNAPVDLAIKIYSQWKLLIEDNNFHDLRYGTELKADMPQFTYRGNRHTRIAGRAIGGNMHSLTTHGEINFNLVYEPNGEFALDVNQDGEAKRIDIYRNTFVGRVRVRNTDSSDGPFRFYNNVIINSDSGTHIYQENVSDRSRIVAMDNLTGTLSQNIVDATGSLTGQYVQYLGTRGHELADIVRPAAPTNVTVQ
ncbi:MAG TPA: Ig domain-containing protein [Steroidobacteraceae bacterium]